MFYLLVEITVVQLAVPAYTHSVATHDPTNRTWVEVAYQQIHVLLELATPMQEIGKSYASKLDDKGKSEMASEWVDQDDRVSGW